MPNYTKEEIEAFARKDKLNSRMSAIKAVSVSYEGTGTSAEDLKEEADKILAWIAQDQVWAGEKQKADVVSDITAPTPTKPQLEALSKFEKLTGLNVAQTWATYGFFPTEGMTVALKEVKDKTGLDPWKVYSKFSKFPDMTNVDKCIERIKGE